MPLVAREVQIIYGSVTLGGTGEYLILPPYSYRDDSRQFQLTCRVLVHDPDVSTFVGLCTTLTDEFTTPRQRLRLIIGTGGEATTKYDLDPSTNTGFNAEPEISQVGTRMDTVRSAVFEVSVTVDLPFTLTGQEGRVGSSVDLITSSNGIRTLQLAGTYTALSSNDARAQFNAEIATWAVDVIDNELGSSSALWEQIAPDTVSWDDTNSLATFRRVYREVIYNQTGAGLNHAAVKEPSLLITRTSLHPGDSLDGVDRPVEMGVVWSAMIDKGTTNLQGFYEGTIRPYLLDLVRQFASGTLTVVQDSPTFDGPRNTIGATLRVIVYPGSVIHSFLSVREEKGTGLDPVAVWSGDKDAKHVFEVARNRIRVVSLTIVADQTVPNLATYLDGTLGLQPSDIDVPASRVGWITIWASGDVTPTRYGESEELFFLMQASYVQMWVTETGGV